MLAPKLPPYDIDVWKTKPFPERVKMVCQSWAEDGYGSPLSVYLVYAVKMALFVGGWLFFCTRIPGVELAEIGQWWASDEAFYKAILWSMLFEGLGLGCGSGPLTARYVPPFGGALYFLRPGTTKVPLWPKLPILGGHKRTVLDVLLYAAMVGALLWALFAPALDGVHLIAIVVLLPVLGIADKTLFLVHRAEHYYSIAICLLFVTDWVAGSKAVWVALWWWAGISKLNHHFPTVIGVMISNAPWARWTPLRKWMYRDFPEDLRPSRAAVWMSHLGTANELLIPVILVFGDGGMVTTVGLAVMLCFHLFITSTIPMGVPLEWNVVMVYGGFVLFGVHADVSISSIDAPLLWAWLMAAHVLVPTLGNVWPERVSFLLSHRYYAGNWAYSVWLFRGTSSEKLGTHLTKWSGSAHEQLGLLYDEKTVDALLSKVVAFRSMHLLGRALRGLVPKAVDDIDDYEWHDGEIVAGMVLGWNFGEGHLHGLQLLEAIQSQCGFEEGELRCIFVESQPIQRQAAHWTIADASSGVMARGEVTVAELREGQPWPELKD